MTNTQVGPPSSDSPPPRPPDRPPSAALSAASSPLDDGPHDVAGVGEVFLDLFPPPALCDDAETYFKARNRLRGVLEGAPMSHAHAVVKAAKDAAESHVERELAACGGVSQ